ncbi:MAG: M14 family zinc carboxypeptidase [Saprospiraceae bacterium]
MKFLTAFFTTILFTTTFLFAQSQQQHSRVKINLETKTVSELAALGLDAEHGDYQPGHYFTGDFSVSEIQQIANAGFTYEIIIDDVQKHYVEQNKIDNSFGNARTVGECSGVGFYDYFVPENFQLGSMGGFFTYEEMFQHLDAMHAQYPDLITERQPIGTILTHEGREIFWLKISDNPEVDETDEAEVFYNSLHHSREPNSLSQNIYFMWYLLERYDTDPEIKYLLDNVELYFIPMVNPDGYVYNETTNPAGGGLWRKNKRDNDGNGIFDPSVDGVDLNRNYGFQWGFDDNGSSPFPASAVYRGEAPFSEPETQNVRDFCNAHEFKIAMNYHTYGNLLIYPWSYSDQLADPAFETIGEALNRENKYFVGTSTETVGYQVNGPADDWMFGEMSSKPPIFSMTPEVGYNTYGFWPPSSEIIRFCQSTILQNLTVAHLPLKYGLATEQNDPIFTDIDGPFNFDFKRYGFQDGEMTVSLEAASSNITATSAPQVFDLDQGDQISSSFDYSLKADIQDGEVLQFVLSVDNGLYTMSDTILKSYGLPEGIYENDFTTLDGWSNFSNFGEWQATTTIFHSAPSSITDSPFNNYLANTESYIQLEDPISLVDAGRATLSFWTQWEIERYRDYAQVQISKDDGTTWEPVCGNYTVAGTVFQDFEEPVYQSFQYEWVYEEMDISEYIGEEILIRFLMKSDDSFFTGDGFYFDDLTVSTFDEVVSSSTFDIEDFSFSQNHPNPARDYTVIDLIESVDGSLHVYNMLGEEIQVRQISNGEEAVVLNTADWAAGFYSYRLLVDGVWSKARKMVVR